MTVEDTRKWVWAQLSAGGAGDEQASPSGPPVPDADLVSAPGPLPPGWYAVRLEGCPVRLGLA